MRGMLDGVGAAVGAHDAITWVPTKFLEAQKVSAWSDLPVWIPGQGETAGFARRDIRKALAAGLTFRPLRDGGRHPGLVQRRSRRSGRPSSGPG